MVQMVLASHNAHKLAELRRILTPLVPGLELLGYEGPEPIENGVSFEENALIKAKAAAAHTGLPAIADDSGICVDVLGGSPGIFSARWGGPQRNDRANVDLLLWQLSDVTAGNRGGSFVCVAALAFPVGHALAGADLAVRGTWAGSILREPAGEDGFGYDPIFQPDGENRSAAELDPSEKDKMSHRNRAFTALAGQLRQLL